MYENILDFIDQTTDAGARYASDIEAGIIMADTLEALGLPVNNPDYAPEDREERDATGKEEK